MITCGTHVSARGVEHQFLELLERRVDARAPPLLHHRLPLLRKAKTSRDSKVQNTYHQLCEVLAIGQNYGIML